MLALRASINRPDDCIGNAAQLNNPDRTGSFQLLVIRAVM
jgi:hypothetical protein